MRKPPRGTAIAMRVFLASTTAPSIGGKTAPPDTEATRNEAPRLVCLPKPLSESVKIVGNTQDSKNNTMQSIAIAASPVVGIAAAMKITQPVKKPKRIQRGLTHFIMNEATKRPTANSACATASKLEPSAVVRLGLTSVT